RVGSDGDEHANYQIIFSVVDAVDGIAASALAAIEAPLSVELASGTTVWRRNFTWEVAESVIYVFVHYDPRKPLEQNDWEFDFDTEGGKQHISVSLSTVGIYPPAMA